ncbi:thiamine diphosphokinase [Lachnoclostridium sp. Marseille-P6806]|uniref:thiamine diphosphokinase n=1 Tax=Lachnoclostridium sp. Marseille-P6806 TaxID=2364793 RepID=UPI0010309509|nr:thiamine diphosphokinase [Lachnoclostridium sp. Marseille-P6806]
MDGRNGKCILMCAGAFVPMEIDVEEADTVIAVDAGLRYLEMLGIRPDYLIGDFDSMQETQFRTVMEFMEYSPERVIRLPVEKDDTDTIYALKFGMELGYRRFFLYGAMGARLDHTVANLQTLLYAKQHGADCYLLDERCMAFVIAEETKRFAKRLTGMFSLFAISDRCDDVTITGMHYNLEHGTLTNAFPLGVSNEFDPGAEDGTGHGAAVTIGRGTALAIVTYEVEPKTRPGEKQETERGQLC